MTAKKNEEEKSQDNMKTGMQKNIRKKLRKANYMTCPDSNQKGLLKQIQHL